MSLANLLREPRSSSPNRHGARGNVPSNSGHCPSRTGPVLALESLLSAGPLGLLAGAADIRLRCSTVPTAAFDPSETLAVHCGNGFQPLSKFLFQWILSCVLSVGADMRRREFITLLGGAAAWPVPARAQQPEGMRRIGVLMAHAESDPEFKTYVAAFRGGLEKLGWTDGRNIRIDFRWGHSMTRSRGNDPQRNSSRCCPMLFLRKTLPRPGQCCNKRVPSPSFL
jgi:hypothetical protein